MILKPAVMCDPVYREQRGWQVHHRLQAQRACSNWGHDVITQEVTMIEVEELCMHRALVQLPGDQLQLPQ